MLAVLLAGSVLVAIPGYGLAQSRTAPPSSLQPAVEPAIEIEIEEQTPPPNPPRPAETVSPASLFPPPGEEQGIAAIINDRVVSDYDVQQRLRLVFATADIPYTPENEERIHDQVIRSLINEQIQIQEGTRLGVTVDTEELEGYLEEIATQNNMGMEDLLTFLTENEINLQTLQQQAYASVTWNKLLQGRFGPVVALSESEINEQHRRMQENFSRPRYQVAEIFLAFDNAREESAIAETSQRLAQELQRGAAFPAIAARFSQSPTAAGGGNIGWVQEGQLAPALDRIIRTMQPGSISVPIRTADGYYILALIDKTTSNEADASRNQFQLTRLLAPVEETASEAELEAAADRINHFAQRFTDCTGIPALAEDLNLETNSIGPIRAGQVAPRLRTVLQSSYPGDILPPQRTSQGVELVIICERQNDRGITITRDMIEDSMFNREMEMIARRYLRDLRRDAVVDIR